MKNSTSQHDWRWLLVFAAVLLLGGIALAARLIPEAGEAAVLRAIGVPAASDRFVDLYGVAVWFDLQAQGIDPTENITTFTLPSGTQVSSFFMNYPPSVFALEAIGVSTASVPVWGWILAVLYLASVLMLSGPIRSAGDAGVWLLIVFSPISLLLVERANIDSLLFALLVVAIALWRYPFFSVAMIVLGGVLKMFPIVALGGVLLSGRRRAVVAAVVGGVIFGAYLLVIREELPGIFSGLKTQYQTCFGARVAPNLLQAHGVLPPELAQSIGGIAVLAALVLGFVCWVCGVGVAAWGNEGAENSGRERVGALAGLAIFCVSFVTGPQMDYKWVFLLLAVPMALRWRRESSWVKVATMWWLAVMAIYSYWTFFSEEMSLRNALLKQGVAWALFAGSSLLLGTAMAGHPLGAKVREWCRRGSLR